MTIRNITPAARFDELNGFNTISEIIDFFTNKGYSTEITSCADGVVIELSAGQDRFSNTQWLVIND